MQEHTKLYTAFGCFVGGAVPMITYLFINPQFQFLIVGVIAWIIGSVILSDYFFYKYINPKLPFNGIELKLGHKVFRDGLKHFVYLKINNDSFRAFQIISAGFITGWILNKKIPQEIGILYDNGEWKNRSIEVVFPKDLDRTICFGPKWIENEKKIKGVYLQLEYNGKKKSIYYKNKYLLHQIEEMRVSVLRMRKAEAVINKDQEIPSPFAG